MIIRRYCDEPMAKKKKLFPCDKRCHQCVACIEVDEDGQGAHAVHGDKNARDMKLFARNLQIRGLHGDIIT